jgi:3-methylcrotonyl-CoA carboxylase alpha subunit
VAVAIAGKTYVASVEIPAGLEPTAGVAPTARVALVDGSRVLFRAGEAWRVTVPTADGITATATGAVADGALRSPMPGRVVNVAVRLGEVVRKDQLLLALEAMKMEHAMRAPFDGVVAELTVAEGAQVAENVVLVRIAASS